MSFVGHDYPLPRRGEPSEEDGENDDEGREHEIDDDDDVEQARANEEDFEF